MDLREKIREVVMPTCEDACSEPGKQADWLADAILQIPAIKEALALREMVGDPAVYARDLDGTGSLHVCAKGDPGAIPLYR